MNTFRTIQLKFTKAEMIAALKHAYPGNLAIMAINPKNALAMTAEGDVLGLSYQNQMGPRYNELQAVRDEGDEAEPGNVIRSARFDRDEKEPLRITYDPSDPTSAA